MMLGEIDYESLYYSTSQSIENGTIGNMWYVYYLENVNPF